MICDECVGLCVNIITSHAGEDLDEVPASRFPVERFEALLAGIPVPPSSIRAKEKPQQFWCSFCGKPRAEVKTLVAGPRVLVCETCVAEALALLHQSGANAT